jgi:hypothetical protein
MEKSAQEGSRFLDFGGARSSLADRFEFSLSQCFAIKTADTECTGHGDREREWHDYQQSDTALAFVRRDVMQMIQLAPGVFGDGAQTLARAALAARVVTLGARFSFWSRRCKRECPAS